MEFKKSLLALGIFTVLSGCGSSDDKSDSGNPDKTTPPTPTVTSTIKGIASKGTFINAPVYFYQYVDGKPVKLTAEQLGSASTMTDEKGQYSAQVKVAGLVKVEIGVSQDVNSPTYMICDAPAGCGQNANGQAIVFGERINMTLKDPTFTLTSLISAAKNEGNVQNTANITPLTHFAAALAEQRGNVSAQSISKAQSEIADTFGLIGALNELIPAKVEDQASLVDGDDSDDLRYALINAGIAQSLFAGSEGNVGEMSARLSSAIADLVAADGAFLVSHDNDDDATFELTLEDILKGAEQATKQIIVLIKQDPVLAKNLSHLADFELLITKLNNEVAKQKAHAGSDGRSKGTENSNTEGDAVAKAAAMVNDVRVFANLFDVADASGDAIQTQGEEFVQLVEDASVMVEAQADSFKLLADVSEALAVIDSLKRAGTITTNTVDLKNYLSLPGATGVATLDETGLVFNVQASAGQESLTASISLTANTTNTEYALNVQGSLENAAAKFMFNEGTKVAITLNKAVTREQVTSDTFDLNAHGIEAVKGTLKLDLTLAQKKTEQVVNPVTFRGQLNAELVPVLVESLDAYYFYESTDNRTTSSRGYNFHTDTIVLPKMIGLSGNFSSFSGEQIAANFTVNVANAQDFQAAGFTQVGRLVEDVATVTFSSNNEAKFTNKDNNQSYTLKLLSNGENDQVVFQREFNSEVEGGYNSKDIITQTQFNGIDYRIMQVGVDGEFPYSYVERVIFSDYNFAYQLEFFNVGIKSYNNGVITTANDELLNLEQLDFATFNRNDNAEQLRQDYGFISDLSSVTDLYSLLKQPSFKTIYALNNKDQGIVVPFTPEAKPEINKPVTLDGRFLRMPSDREYTVVVNQDGTQVTASINELVESHSVIKPDNNSFSYSYSLTDKDAVVESQQVTFAQADIADQLKPYILKSTKTYSGGYQQNYYVHFEPISQNDGQYVQYKTYILYPHAFNEQGQPVNEQGNVLNALTQGTSYDDPTDLQYAFEYVKHNAVSFGLYESEPALQAFKSKVWGQANEEHTIDREGYGKYFVYYNRYNRQTDSRYFESIQANTTTLIPTYFMPEDTFELEDENNFLGISAALNLDVVLGDYAVDLTIGAQRTEYAQGKVELDIKYVIPGSTAQRSFIVEYDTKTASLSAKNAEGVTLVLSNDVENTDAEVEIGKIMVGDKVGATVLKRGSLILVKYTDGIIESL